MHTLIVSILTALVAGSAAAGEREIRQAVQALAPEAKVVSVRPTPIAGLHEVVLDGPRGPTLVYASAKGDYLILGELLDVKNRRNLTGERMDDLTRIKFDSLPLGQAIKIVQGNGRRRLAVFSDPDCPYCRKVEQELVKLKDVTIYMFPYPLPMHPDAARKSRLVWCSRDRAAAWRDMMLNNKLPEGVNPDCDHPVDKNLALGARLRVEGTPALFFADGRRLPGYAEAARIEQMLAAAEGQRGK
ncbi:MAG: DsbC family protein [Burkholderiales bacterium]|nr:DsbC family protein [Burkholderiales bacterium]